MIMQINYHNRFFILQTVRLIFHATCELDIDILVRYLRQDRYTERLLRSVVFVCLLVGWFVRVFVNICEREFVHLHGAGAAARSTSQRCGGRSCIMFANIISERGVHTARRLYRRQRNMFAKNV